MEWKVYFSSLMKEYRLSQTSNIILKLPSLKDIYFGGGHVTRFTTLKGFNCFVMGVGGGGGGKRLACYYLFCLRVLNPSILLYFTRSENFAQADLDQCKRTYNFKSCDSLFYAFYKSFIHLDSMEGSTVSTSNNKFIS